MMKSLECASGLCMRHSSSRDLRYGCIWIVRHCLLPLTGIQLPQLKRTQYNHCVGLYNLTSSFSSKLLPLIALQLGSWLAQCNLHVFVNVFQSIDVNSINPIESGLAIIVALPYMWQHPTSWRWGAGMGSACESTNPQRLPYRAQMSYIYISGLYTGRVRLLRPRWMSIGTCLSDSRLVCSETPVSAASCAAFWTSTFLSTILQMKYCVYWEGRS